MEKKMVGATAVMLVDMLDVKMVEMMADLMVAMMVDLLELPMVVWKAVLLGWWELM